MDYLYLITLSGGDEVDRTSAAACASCTSRSRATNPDGSKYHALEPEAYAWVHATLIEATVREPERKFVGPMQAATRSTRF